MFLHKKDKCKIFKKIESEKSREEESKKRDRMHFLCQKGLAVATLKTKERGASTHKTKRAVRGALKKKTPNQYSRDYENKETNPHRKKCLCQEMYKNIFQQAFLVRGNGV